jgi:phosphoglycolate phosphatase-like HAD superfamily hydrolase
MNEKLNPAVKYYKWASKRKWIPKTETYKAVIKKEDLRSKSREFENRILSKPINLSMSFLVPRLHNGVREVLNELDSSGKKIALLTNGNIYRVIKEIERLKIENYFDAIESAQELGAWKPNPLGIEILIKSLKSDKKNTIYVGDSADDVDSARFAGVKSCAVANGFDSRDNLLRHKPDFIFESMEELYRSL